MKKGRPVNTGGGEIFRVDPTSGQILETLYEQ